MDYLSSIYHQANSFLVGQDDPFNNFLGSTGQHIYPFCYRPTEMMFQEPWQKPPYSYIALITMAISSTADRKMTLNQVTNKTYC